MSNVTNELGTEQKEGINALETVVKEKDKKVGLLKSELSDVTNELKTLQKESSKEIDLLQGKLSGVTNELEIEQKERINERNLLRDQFLDIAGKTHYLEQTLKERNIDYANQLKGVQERERLS